MAKAADKLMLEGVSRLDEAKLRAKAKALQKQMWKTTILTKERRDLEKRVNALKKAAREAKKIATSKILKGDPVSLWRSPPKSRKINWAGTISQITTGVPSDALLAVAGGARPGPGVQDAEYRKSILGGLLAMRAAGAIKLPDAESLKAPLVGSKKINEALAKAAGMPGKSLEQVFSAVQKKVAAYGPGMSGLAWSIRAQLYLRDIKGIEAVHAAAAAVTAAIPLGVTQVVGAAVAAHSAITMALASAMTTKLELDYKKALPKAKAEAEKYGGARGKAELEKRIASGAGMAPGLFGLPLPMLGLGAAALLGVGVVVVSRRSA